MAQIDHVIKLIVSDFPFLPEQTVKTYSNAYETVSDVGLRQSLCCQTQGKKNRVKKASANCRLLRAAQGEAHV